MHVKDVNLLWFLGFIFRTSGQAADGCNLVEREILNLVPSFNRKGMYCTSLEHLILISQNVNPPVVGKGEEASTYVLNFPLVLSYTKILVFYTMCEEYILA